MPVDQGGGLWEELAKQIPALCVLCYLTWTFLAHLRGRDEVLRDLTASMAQTQQETRAAINRNSEALGANTQVIGEIQALLGNNKG